MRVSIKSFVTLTLCATLLVTFSACEKDSFVNQEHMQQRPTAVEVRSGEEETQTILGSLRSNPYTVATMTG